MCSLSDCVLQMLKVEACLLKLLLLYSWIEACPLYFTCCEIN